MRRKRITPSNAAAKRRDESERYLNAVTYVNIFCQQLIGHSVFVEDVVVDRGTAKSRSSQESKEPGEPKIRLAGI